MIYLIIKAKSTVKDNNIYQKDEVTMSKEESGDIFQNTDDTLDKQSTDTKQLEMEFIAKESGNYLESNEHFNSNDDLKHTLISLLSKKKSGHSDLELSLRSLLSKEKTKIY